MAGKENPSRIKDIYSNKKGYTYEQIDDFNTERQATMFLAFMEDHGADFNLKSGELFFSERQKSRAALDHEMGEDRDLIKEAEAFKASFIKQKNAVKTPPEPELLFDRIHRGKYVFISKEGKARTTKIVFPL